MQSKVLLMQFIWSIIGHMLGFLPTPKCLQILCWQFINSHQINSAFNCKFFLRWTIFFSPMPGTQWVIFDLNQSRLVPLKEKGTLQEGWTSFKTTASQTLLSLLIMWTTVTHSTANSHSHISPTFPGFRCLWDRDRSPSWRPRPSPPSGQWSSRCCR